MLKAVIFDLDNTLYDFDAAHRVAFGAVRDFACERLSLTPERFDALHREAAEVLKARCGANSAAIHNRLLRFQVLLERIGRPFSLAPKMADLYWSKLFDVMEVFPGAAEALRALRGMGLKVGVGTNMTAARQYAKLERMGIMDDVDFIVTSEEAGAEKPDRRLFDLCAEKAGCPARQCVFVGDSLKSDIGGALGAGMRAVWLHPGSDPSDAPEGVLTIRTPDELPDVLKEHYSQGV